MTKILVHRPLFNLSVIHSVIYFIPVYMAGIMCSLKKERVFKFLEGNNFIIGLSVALLSVAQILIYSRYGNFHKEAMLSYAGIDLMLFQKILMCFFLLSVLQKFENRNIAFLKYIASASFAIYFIHPWILYSFSYLSVFERFNFLPGFLGLVVTLSSVMVLSLAIATLFKWAFPNKSRFVIGW